MPSPLGVIVIDAPTAKISLYEAPGGTKNDDGTPKRYIFLGLSCKSGVFSLYRSDSRVTLFGQSFRELEPRGHHESGYGIITLQFRDVITGETSELKLSGGNLIVDGVLYAAITASKPTVVPLADFYQSYFQPPASPFTPVLIYTIAPNGRVVCIAKNRDGSWLGWLCTGEARRSLTVQADVIGGKVRFCVEGFEPFYVTDPANPPKNIVAGTQLLTRAAPSTEVHLVASLLLIPK